MFDDIQYQYRSVPLSGLNLADEDNRISLPADYARLEKSISETGLISPVIVCASGVGYKVICGFKRLDILKKIKPGEAVKCLVCDPPPPARQLALNIAENTSSRQLDPVEAANALSKLSAFYERGEIIEKFLPAMNIQKSEYAYNKYLSLTALCRRAKEFTASERIPLAAALQIVKFSGSEQEKFLDVIEACRMGANLINETAQLVFETSMQYGVCAEEILTRAGCETIISNSDLTPNQKTDEIRRALHSLKRPMYESVMARFKELASEFDSRKISLNPFAYFEKDEISVKFNIASVKDLEQKIAALLRLKDSRLASEFLKKNAGQAEACAKKGTRSDD
ncbi:MAG TPA: ParB N-terminal domain-containing protein [Candidatus Wallbacteria bacterium]|nr:ParB N-terminal domain-containing protein [Candidatus Wallbacteria bacterium]